MCFSPKSLNFSGRKFDCNLLNSLRDFKLLNSQSTNMDYNRTIFSNNFHPSEWTPTFVTAASDNHFMELRHLLHNIQEKNEKYKIVFYDLGLSEKNVSYFLYYFGQFSLINKVEN